MHDTRAAPPLDALYQRHSKHSSYQQVHPLLAPLLGRPGDLPVGKLEAQRQRFFASQVGYAGARVLDIGANTGYFSFAAIASGAATVQCYEGNADHAEFIRAGAGALGLADRLQVQARYFEFQAGLAPRYDIVLCLNVLHHLGDDFGDRSLAVEPARQRMLACLNGLADATSTLILQLGFNWKGDVRHPLFDGGEKAAQLAFVEQGTRGAWSLAAVAVPDPSTREYEPLSPHNLARNDAVGEFMNRPLFVLRSRRVSKA
jgi:SAM-dependent methyltransferase